MQATDSRSLRHQAEQLQQAAQKLIEAADVLEGFGKSNGDVQTHSLPPKKKIERLRVGVGTPRLDELKKFIALHGPLSRKEIIARAGMPKGTIAHLLKAANGFKRDENKKWSCMEQK